MTHADVARLAQHVVASFPQQELPPPTVQLWRDDFQRCHFDCMCEAVDQLRRSQSLMPTIAELLGAHDAVCQARHPQLVRGGSSADDGVLYWVVRELRSMSQLQSPEKWPLSPSQLVEHRFPRLVDASAKLHELGRGHELIAVMPPAQDEAPARPAAAASGQLHRLRVVHHGDGR